MKHAKPVILVVLLLSLLAGAAGASQWETTNVQLLYGDGYLIVPPAKRTIITVEHASGWTYGDNFFFFDLGEPFNTESYIYGEWHPRFSFGKIFKGKAGFGFIKDTLIATELNIEYGWRAYLYGIGFDLEIPGFEFFALNVMVRDDRTIDDDSTWQISPSWNVPFKLARTQWEFRGFLDWSGAEGEFGKYQVLTQPQLLLNLGSLHNRPGSLWFGAEWQYWKNKFGIEGETENLLQVMGKWVF